MSSDKKGNGKFIVGAAIGAAVGALAGILFAPKSGKETRKAIKDKAGEVAEKGKEFVQEKGGKIGDEIKEKIDDIKEKIEKEK